ncbi:MAG: hypothetical protein KTR25_03575 [Myxococcales bacterium]|nr:hypothetical protein [Myxococcales bacterium]
MYSVLVPRGVSLTLIMACVTVTSCGDDESSATEALNNDTRSIAELDRTDLQTVCTSLSEVGNDALEGTSEGLCGMGAWSVLRISQDIVQCEDIRASCMDNLTNSPPTEDLDCENINVPSSCNLSVSELNTCYDDFFEAWQEYVQIFTVSCEELEQVTSELAGATPETPESCMAIESSCPNWGPKVPGEAD